MRLESGSHLGPYVVEALLGAGGMGEVYRARDTRLGRTVALKILLHTTDDFRQRFQREARSVASLNHPNICTLFDTGRHEDTDYLVMEHLEGQTLYDRLRKGPLGVDEAISIAIQIAAALATAHEAGVIHRDLKPGNVMLTRTGTKLLDFGLATHAAQPREPDDQTRTMALTSQGMAPGTLPYMAPEQLEGAPATPRGDIFAFGAMLYEMVTGRRAFPGASQASTIAAIMRSEVPPLIVPDRDLDRIIRSCTEKKPEDRWHCARDLQTQLQWLAQARHEAMPAMKVPSARRWLIAASLIATIAALGWFRAFTRTPPAQNELRVSVMPPDNVFFEPLSKDSGGSAISPDGRYLAFTARQAGRTKLWVRTLDSLDAKPLPGTEEAGFPFWSPDSRTIGFFAGNKLETIPVAAQGTAAIPETISTNAASRGGSWNSAGTILFTPTTGNVVQRVAATGGPASPVTTLNTALNETAHLWPRFLPDGDHFLYYAKHTQPRTDGIFVASLTVGKPMRITDATSSAWFVPASGKWSGTPKGHLLFVRGQTLFSQPFDSASLALSDDAVAVATGVETVQAAAAADFSVSAGATLAYRSGTAMTSQMTWFDTTGTSAATLGPEGIWAEPRISPDQKSVVATRADPQTGNVDSWITPLSSGVPSRFTFAPDLDLYPVWSPDGKQIVYASNKPPLNLFTRPADGSGEEKRLTTSPNVQRARDVSPDNRYIAYDDLSPDTLDDIWILPFNPPGDPFPFVKTPARERQAQFSPAGSSTIAFTSDESGRNEVYLRGFHPVSRAISGKWQVSANGGSQPRWRRDGKELYFLEGDRMMAVEIRPSGPGVSVGTSRRLFDTKAFAITELGPDYDVSADGQRFLALSPVLDRTGKAITVALNWLHAR